MINNYYVHGGGLHMQGDNYTFNDRAAGVFGRDNSVSGGTFNAGGISLAEVLAAIEAARPSLPAETGRELDAAAEEMREAEGDPGRLRTALQKIAGIASLAGNAGASVVEAVKSIMSALNG